MNTKIRASSCKLPPSSCVLISEKLSDHSENLPEEKEDNKV